MVKPASLGFSPTPEYLREKEWATAHGVPVTDGEVVVIAKRRGGPHVARRYEDEFVVLTRDGGVVRLPASTKPAQRGSEVIGPTVPDVNHDGVKDVGIVRPGNYFASGDGGRTYGQAVGLPRPAFRVSSTPTNDKVPTWRDTDGDGHFSAAEREASERAGHTLGLARIHLGFDEFGTETPKGLYAGPWSVGCQNVPNSRLDEFVEAVGGTRAKFRFSIVDDDGEAGAPPSVVPPWAEPELGSEPTFAPASAPTIPDATNEPDAPVPTMIAPDPLA